MIVLDEHLMAPNLVSTFRWYPGAVRTLPELAGFAGAEDDLVPAIPMG